MFENSADIMTFYLSEQVKWHFVKFNNSFEIYLQQDKHQILIAVELREAELSTRNKCIWNFIIFFSLYFKIHKE